MPWGRLIGEAPGYSTAAARPLQSSCNDEEKRTNSRLTDGRPAALSGTSFFDAQCCAATSGSFGFPGAQKQLGRRRGRPDRVEQAARLWRHVSGFKSWDTMADFQVLTVRSWE